MTFEKAWRSFLPQLLVGFALATSVSGCYVEAEGPRRPPRCHEAAWVRDHRDRYGEWHPGHYRCVGEGVSTSSRE